MAQLEEQEPWFKRLFTSKCIKILLAVSCHLLVGPWLIVVNKEIMDRGFRYPITLSCLGQMTVALYAIFMVKTGRIDLREESKELLAGWNWYKRCLPVGVCKAATLSFGNAVYLYLNMGFIQMLKAFSPVLILTLAAVLRIDYPKPAVTGSVLAIAFFTACTVVSEPRGSLLGLCFMSAAQFSEALGLVLTQFLLKNCKFGVTEGLYVLAPPSVVCMWVAGLMGGEWYRIYTEKGYLFVLQHPLLFLQAATLGLFINALTFCVIQLTSSVTLKILSTARNVLPVIIGATRYGEAIPPTEWLSYTGSLAGFFSYTYFQMNPEKGDLCWNK
eukprot:Sspe_Gene.4615::Locus_1519_Transcript_1_1_Confidence_1.000_Length_1045::g.4615::m.4615